MFSTLKRSRNVHNNHTTILDTPVGSYFGQDVLEGFAADAEYLGRPNEENNHFDQDFPRVCKLENA